MRIKMDDWKDVARKLAILVIGMMITVTTKARIAAPGMLMYVQQRI
jgi:hypothetical protein